jgi:mannan endo-1,4-beta-mannosidase
MIPVANWWTTVLLPIVQDAGLSYVLLWRNSRPNHYYAPYPGQASADDFKVFATNPQIMLETKARQARLYRPLQSN